MNRAMSYRAAALAAMVLWTTLPTQLAAQPRTGTAAQPATADDAHRRSDIVRHRAIAAAHEDAARCLEAGQKESVCHAALRKACEGLAVGRYCGMKHVH